MDAEIWRDIPEYEGLYEVSTYGRVRSLRYRGRNKINLLKLFKNENGYFYIELSKEGVRKKFSIHRLVAKVFIPNPNNLEQVNHKNEIKDDNRVDNLEWCTQSYNQNYGTRNERVRKMLIGENNPQYGKLGKEHNKAKPIYQYSKDGVLVKMWDSAMDIQRELGINNKYIGSCARGKYKSSHGYVWKYA